MIKLLQRVVVMAVILAATPVAFAEEYFFPGRDFVGGDWFSYHNVQWPSWYPEIQMDWNLNWGVVAPLPHFETANGMTVTVYGRYLTPNAFRPRCYVAAVSHTGATLMVPGTNPVNVIGPWTSVITLTQAQVDACPALMVTCGVSIDSIPRTIISGVSVSFGWAADN